MAQPRPPPPTVGSKLTSVPNAVGRKVRKLAKKAETFKKAAKVAFATPIMALTRTTEKVAPISNKGKGLQLRSRKRKKHKKRKKSKKVKKPNRVLRSCAKRSKRKKRKKSRKK